MQQNEAELFGKTDTVQELSEDGFYASRSMVCTKQMQPGTTHLGERNTSIFWTNQLP